MDTDALSLTSIDAYYGDSHVLHGISLALGQARLLGLLGRNGAGKTTCMNVAIGLLPPRRGTVTIGGDDVTGRAPGGDRGTRRCPGPAGTAHLP